LRATEGSTLGRDEARSRVAIQPIRSAGQILRPAFAGDPDVAAGRMMASFGLKVNGRIFTMHARGCFVAKLPRARVDELVEACVGEHFDPGHGRRMNEWISIGPGRADWVALAREAYAFVKSAG
jgi:hypothetical protein